jgi:endonuclease/exonuclease/phosphatase family metal-dependent hydrolase
MIEAAAHMGVNIVCMQEVMRVCHKSTLNALTVEVGVDDAVRFLHQRETLERICRGRRDWSIDEVSIRACAQV